MHDHRREQPLPGLPDHRTPAPNHTWGTVARKGPLGMVLLGTALLGTVLVGAGGCAGSIRGEIDGTEVPPFASAAFGTGDLTNGSLLIGFASDDGCSHGSGLVDLLKDATEAQTEQDGEDVRDRSMDWTNELAIDSWYVTAVLGAEDEVDFRDELVDLSEATPAVNMNVSLCRRKREARIREGQLENGSECYRASDGDLRVSQATPDELSLVSDGNIKFIDGEGDTAGRVDLEFTFRRCDALSEGTQDYIDALEARQRQN